MVLKRTNKTGQRKNSGRWVMALFCLAVLSLLSFQLIPTAMARFTATSSGSAAASVSRFDVDIYAAEFTGATSSQTTDQSYVDYNYTLVNKSEVIIRARAVVDSGQATLFQSGWFVIGIGASEVFTVRVDAIVSKANTVQIHFEYEQMD